MYEHLQIPKNSISITNNPTISAIYYALLQTGYEYYSLERTKEHTQQVRSFLNPQNTYTFSSITKQDTCFAYPYWPRAFMLELATYYISLEHCEYTNFPEYQKRIMTAGNISEKERDQSFWKWVKDFPSAIKNVISDNLFLAYMEWEQQWINKQNLTHSQDLVILQHCLDFCKQTYTSSIQDIQILLSPIKCVYSSDYHIMDNVFIFTSGSLRIESIVHEFLHHIVHPVIVRQNEHIGNNIRKYPGIDDSYYLSGNIEGQQNAFEEYVVRTLTKDFLTNTPPNDLIAYIVALL